MKATQKKEAQKKLKKYWRHKAYIRRLTQTAIQTIQISKEYMLISDEEGTLHDSTLYIAGGSILETATTYAPQRYLLEQIGAEITRRKMAWSLTKNKHIRALLKTTTKLGRHQTPTHNYSHTSQAARIIMQALSGKQCKKPSKMATQTAVGTANMQTLSNHQHTMRISNSHCYNMENQKNTYVDKTLNAQDGGRFWQPRSGAKRSHMHTTQETYTHAHTCVPICTHALENHKHSHAHMLTADAQHNHTCNPYTFSSSTSQFSETQFSSKRWRYSLGADFIFTQTEHDVWDTEPSDTQGTHTTKQP